MKNQQTVNTVNQIKLNQVQENISEVEKEMQELQRQLNTLGRKRESLFEDKERILYNGMTHYEFLSYLNQNPILKMVNEFKIQIKYYNIIVEYVLPDGIVLRGQTDVYTDQSLFIFRIKTTKQEKECLSISDVPKKYQNIAKKIQEIAFAEKMVYPSANAVIR